MFYKVNYSSGTFIPVYFIWVTYKTYNSYGLHFRQLHPIALLFMGILNLDIFPGWRWLFFNIVPFGFLANHFRNSAIHKSKALLCEKKVHQIKMWPSKCHFSLWIQMPLIGSPTLQLSLKKRKSQFKKKFLPFWNFKGSMKV